MKLNATQQKALEFMPKQWDMAPRGVRSGTLLALLNRELVECRPAPNLRVFGMSYTSAAWQWRKV